MWRRTVLSAVLTWASLVTAVEQPYKDIKVNGVAPCDNNDDLNVSILSHDVERIDRSIIEVNASTEVKHELPTDLCIKVEIRRCDSKSATSTCSRFFEQEFENFCERITEEKAPWANAVKTTSPQIECPVKPDTFLTIGTVVDASVLDNAPEGYWTAKVEAVRGDEKVFCLMADAEIIEVLTK